MMKARISHLHNTQLGWSKFDSWVPEAGELVVYDPDSNCSYARIKIGDGIKNLYNLPFLIDSAALALIQKQHYFEIIDAGRVTDYK